MKSKSHTFIALLSVFICLIVLPLGQMNMVLCFEQDGCISIEQGGEFGCVDSESVHPCKSLSQEVLRRSESCKECVDIGLSLGVVDVTSHLTLSHLDSELGPVILHPSPNIGNLVGFLSQATSSRFANPPPLIGQQTERLKTVRLLI